MSLGDRSARLTGNISPQIVFEILSPRNYQPEMKRVELKETAQQAHLQEQQAKAQEQQTKQALIQEQQRSQAQLDQMVMNLLRSGTAVQQIAAITGCSIDYVESLQS